MSNLAIKILEYLKQNRLPIPINVKNIKLDYSLNDISNAVIELASLGYFKLFESTDQHYPVIAIVNRLD